MNEWNLKNLIRGSRQQREDALLPDASSLAALASDEPVSPAECRAARIAESGRNADLYRFARDLQPFSEQLSRDLRTQFAADGDQAVTHRRIRRSPHSTRFTRPWRWAATATAACLALVAGLWATHHRSGAHGTPTGVTTASVVGKKVPDRIFAAFNDKTVAVSELHRGDTIFRSDFRSGESGPRRNQG